MKITDERKTKKKKRNKAKKDRKEQGGARATVKWLELSDSVMDLS